jgi:thiol-disulfide isomerase/thioredoxin
MKGKYVLLNFWGTWCAACITELPDLKDIQQLYGGDELEIVSIASEFTESNVKAFIDSMRMTWTHIAEYKPDDNSIKALYGIESWPASFLIDKKGKFAEMPYSYIKDSNGRIKHVSFWGHKIMGRLEKYLKPTKRLEKYYENGNGLLISYSQNDAGEVYIAGSFNNWLQFPLYKYKGKWIRRLDLPSGVYQYKIIVDGKWITDPSNPNVTDDGKGNINSKMVIK